MEKAEQLVSVYTQFGAIGLIIAILIVVLIMQFSDFGKRINKIIIDKMFSKKKEINFYVFLRRLEHVRDYNIKNVNIKCRKRKEIFHDFAENRVNNLIQFVKSIMDRNLEDMSEKEISYMFSEGLYKTRMTSDTEIARLGIPVSIVEKMHIIEKDEAKILSSIIDNICSSTSNYIARAERVAVIIDFICVLANVSVINAETCIDSLNGQLDGIVYKGYSCETCYNMDCPKKEKKKNV